jgi:hypothetical protein
MNTRGISLPAEDLRTMKKPISDYDDNETVTGKNELTIDQRTKKEEKNKTREKKDFPWKLHVMLEDAEKEHNQDIVSWDPVGMSFKVYKPEEFVKEIMPRYFKQTQFRSFQRMVRQFSFECFRHHSTSFHLMSDHKKLNDLLFVIFL